MKKMIVQRLLHLVVVLFLVTLVSFFLMYFSPGDPVTALLSRGGTVPDPDVVAQKRAELGLDRPVAEQYVAWLAGIFQGNLGTSISSGRPVASEIAARMPATLFLAVTSLALTLVVSIPLGCLCALKKNRATDLIIRFASFVGASVPGFLMALILVFMFSLTLHWLPSIGSMKGVGWVLPVLTLVLCESAMYIRQIRTIVLQEMEQDYVEAARLRGISDVAILSRSVLKAAAPTILVLTGMTFAQLLGGSAIIENVFSWPGIGFYAVQAVFARDYPVVQAYVLIVAVLFVLVNLCVDLLQARIDPRARLALEQSAAQDRRGFGWAPCALLRHCCAAYCCVLVRCAFVVPTRCRTCQPCVVEPRTRRGISYGHRFAGSLHFVSCPNGIAHHRACRFGGCGFKRCYRFGSGCVVGVYRRRVRFRGNAHYRCLYGVPDFGFGHCHRRSSGRRFAECGYCAGGSWLDALCAHCPFFRVGVERAPLHSGSSYWRPEQNGNRLKACVAQHSSAPDCYGVLGHRRFDAQFGGTFFFGLGCIASFARVGCHDQSGGIRVPNCTLGGVRTGLCHLLGGCGVQLFRRFGQRSAWE